MLRSKKIQRNIPEGGSFMKKTKSKQRVDTSPSPEKTLKKGKGKKTKVRAHSFDSLDSSSSPEKSPMKRKGMADSPSYFDQTPESLSQISSIMPPDESTMMENQHSPSKKRKKSMMRTQAKDADTTMEMAVRHARGEPDGADTSIRQKKSPKKKSKAKLQMSDIPEAEEEASPAKHNKENDTVLAQKGACMQPLKKVSEKIKAMKAANKKKVFSSKVKKNFDKTLPDETLVPKKPTLTFKERRKERKMENNNYELIHAAKGVWEDLRRQKLDDVKRQELCSKLFDKVKGKVKDLAVVHDSSRVVQCLVQYGQPQVRAAILEEIKPHVAELTKDKYAKYVIRKMLKYGSRMEKGVVIKAFHGNVRKLIKHREASDIVNYAYNDFANASQRLFLLEEFYGPAFTMFKTQSTLSLDDILTQQPERREMIMNNLKAALLPLIEKEVLSLYMVHKIFYDFFKYADPKLQKEMTEALRESLIHMVHTREGARVAMGCIWNGSVKDRKLIVKSMKGLVVKMCKEETGHMMLLSVFDAVDDTVLVQKIILDEIMKNIVELINDVNGRKVLIYLLVRRDQKFFCPDVTKILQQGDSNATSKKDTATRAQELKDYVSDGLLTHLAENATELLSNSKTSLMTPLILANASGKTQAAMDALAQTVVSSSDPAHGKAGGTSLVDDAATHITLKKILQTDRHLMHQGRDALFSVALLNAADASTLKAWVASNRGCFLLCTMFEVENAEVSKSLREQLAPLRKYLKKMTFKGAEILLAKIDGQPTTKQGRRPLEISL